MKILFLSRIQMGLCKDSALKHLNKLFYHIDIKVGLGIHKFTNRYVIDLSLFLFTIRIII